MLFPLWVKFENVECVLCLNLIVQAEAMGDLIFFLYKIEFLLDCWVVLIPVLTHLEKHLNHILHALINISLVEDVSELVEHCKCNGRIHFLQMLANFSGEANCNFHTVIRGLVEKEQQNLSSQHLMGNLLVA
jgi:hypothetical protein